MATLSIDFNKALRQADALEQIARGIQQQNRNLGNISETIRGLWQGETVDAYLKKLEAFSAQLLADARGCQSAAKSYRNQIADLQQAEAEAENIASSGE